MLMALRNTRATLSQEQKSGWSQQELSNGLNNETFFVTFCKNGGIVVVVVIIIR